VQEADRREHHSSCDEVLGLKSELERGEKAMERQMEAGGREVAEQLLEGGRRVVVYVRALF
jgi:hypothetical protein